MYVFLTMLRVLLSLPLAILWIAMYLILMLGWGLKRADSFMLHWNKFVVEGDVDVEGEIK